MAKIGLPKGSGKRLKDREKTVKSQGILKWILSGNPDKGKNSVRIRVNEIVPRIILDFLKIKSCYLI